jgi:hypothetical protein
MPFPGSYYTNLLHVLVANRKIEEIKELGNRLTDSEEATTILRAKGYDGQTLADMVRKVPPATLRHS